MISALNQDKNYIFISTSLQNRHQVAEKKLLPWSHNQLIHARKVLGQEQIASTDNHSELKQTNNYRHQTTRLGTKF